MAHINFMGKFGGRLVRDSDVYQVKDDERLQNLIVSKTTLNPLKQTSGHSHDGLDEVYVFTGSPGQRGEMIVGEERFKVAPGMIILVPQGLFHQVINTEKTPLEFIAIFQRYDRGV